MTCAVEQSIVLLQCQRFSVTASPLGRVHRLPKARRATKNAKPRRIGAALRPSGEGEPDFGFKTKNYLCHGFPVVRGFMVMIECESVVRGCAFRSDRSGIDRHKTPRINMRQWERDGSCFDHLSPCLSQFYCWLPRRIRQQRRGYASRGIFTMAEADFTTTESTRKQVPCGPGERSRQSHMAQGLPPICIRPAIRFIANTPVATRVGVVSSVMVRAIPSKKAITSCVSCAWPQHLTLAMVLARAVYS